ncbi:DUF6159 family protein [Natronorubrum halophilum]|uniref:DUF6159 family protein n=1 Tax=Natronorubrum halophilum TaxID=1702106 RepID=UPI0010C23A57|nr:DUF6159 family protein [Natronorubrum halophilum]
MTGRFRDGVAVTNASLDVFRKRPRLAVLPLLSLAAVGSAYAVLAVAILRYELVGALFTSSLVRYGVLFVALAVSSGVGIFFNAAVVHCATRQFAGEETSVSEGVAAAWEARTAIVKWGLVSATIGTVLYIAEDNVPGVGTLTRSVLDLGWALLTFFIVPVIVTDRTGSLRSDLRKSGDAFSRTWGESLTATIGIGLALLPVSLLGVCLLVFAYLFATGPTAFVAGVLGGLLLVATIVVTQVLGMIIRAALYQYAVTGDPVGPLADLEPGQLFDER